MQKCQKIKIDMTIKNCIITRLSRYCFVSMKTFQRFIIYMMFEFTYFSTKEIDMSIKYFGPSYHIRSVPANASDAIFCYQLAAHAVHAGMSGKTNLVIGHWNNFFTHVPIDLATSERRMIDLDSVLWKGVISTTQQDNDLEIT